MFLHFAVFAVMLLQQFFIKSLVPHLAVFHFRNNILEGGVDQEILDHFHNVPVNEIGTAGINEYKGIFRHLLQLVFDNGLF